MRLFLHLVTWILFLYSFFPISSFSLSHLCLGDQSSALLQFKQSFSINSNATADPSGYPKVRSWKPNTDCCSWDGVTCHGDTGRVIKLELGSSFLYGPIDSKSSIFRLHDLQVLNLADNDFNYSLIPSAFDRLPSLTHLNLSFSIFSGQIPLQISLLAKLVSLDLSRNEGLKLQSPNLRTLTQNLSNLRELRLDEVNMSAKVNNNWCQSSSFALPNLRVLSLSDCSLPRFMDESLLNFHFLSELNLGMNNFSSMVPEFLGSLTSLTKLNLYNCFFYGLIPHSLANLTQLITLDLSFNNLQGDIKLSLFFLPSLQHLSLSGNQLTAIIQDFHSENSSSVSSLHEVYLSSNQLKGMIPRSFLHLTSLEVLYLSFNDFDDSMDFNMLEDLKNNSAGNFTSLQLLTFVAISCKFQKLPVFLRYQNHLENLYLSSNQIHGKIPNWIWKPYMRRLALSNNSISGLEFPIPNLLEPRYEYINLKSNKIQEEIPVTIPLENDLNNEVTSNILGNLTSYLINATTFIISDNKLTGNIPSSICNLNRIQILDLSNNQLSGQIPECPHNFGQFLEILNLGKNKFHGTIPQIFVNGSNLSWLNMRNNHFEGRLPRSLANCKRLEVLDLGNNQINDTFPFWMENLTQLQVLVLRSNKFHGPIIGPRTYNAFPMMRIIDLSFNNFTNKLPSEYFHCWKAMRTDNKDALGQDYMRSYNTSIVQYYQVTVISKGRETEFERILKVFTTIDFSYNRFQWEIPQAIGDLTQLKVLNLSGNCLTGQIPSSLGNLLQLESLDLSRNQLSGEIPLQLTSITFLSMLNVSQNQLVGSIPQGKQFDTFDNTSYGGNLGLCGIPLSMTCGTTDSTSAFTSKTPQQEQYSTGILDYKIVLMGYGCGIIIGVVIGGEVPSWRIDRFFKITSRKRGLKLKK